MMGLKRRAVVKEVFKNLQVLTVYSLYVLETVKYVKEFCLPNNSQDHRPYNTRQTLTIEAHRLELFKKKPSYVGRTFLRLLPDNISKINSPQKFYNAAKQYLVNHPLYSFEELTYI